MKPLPKSCADLASTLEADPLHLPPAAVEHLKHCRACSEARVFWIAQAEDPEPSVPEGYFERLPQRILRKLPPARSRTSHHFLLAAAGLLALCLGLGGFWLGRAHRAPLVEATLPQAPALDVAPVTEAPFHESDSPYLALDDLSPQEAQTLVQRLSETTSTPQG